jgi:hypothetical protein
MHVNDKKKITKGSDTNFLPLLSGLENASSCSMPNHDNTMPQIAPSIPQQ